jgi:hypothetical protein
MNPLRRFSITFGSILLLGGLVFVYQTRRLGEIGRGVTPRSTAMGNAVPTRDEISDTGEPAKKTGEGTRQPDKDEAAEFIGKLKAALANSLTEDQVIAFLNMGTKGATFETIAAAANLTLEESATIRERLEKFDQERAALYLNHDLTPAALNTGLAEVNLRQDKWLAGQLGADRYAELIRYDDRRSRNSAKQRAAESVARIGSATDLTEAQKEKLNEGFLELNLRTPETAVENKLVVETNGSLELGPSAPDLSEEVEKILTPEQLEDYQLQREAIAQNTEARSEVLMEMMQSLMPAVIRLLENDP